MADLGSVRLHDASGQEGQVPVAGDADRLEAGIAGLAAARMPSRMPLS